MSARQFRRHLHSASAGMQVACDGDALIGASLLFFRCGSDCARLYSLVVAAAARGRGLGARLLADAEQAARDRGCRWLRLEVRDDNRSAIVMRSEEHTSELQSLMRISYAVFCLKKKTNTNNRT